MKRCSGCLVTTVLYAAGAGASTHTAMCHTCVCTFEILNPTPTTHHTPAHVLEGEMFMIFDIKGPFTQPLHQTHVPVLPAVNATHARLVCG